MKKIKLIVTALFITFYTSLSSTNVFALEIDTAAALSEISQAKTAMLIILGAVTVVGVLWAIGKVTIKTLLSSDEDKDYKEYWKKIGQIIAIGVISGMAGTLLVIFGIK